MANQITIRVNNWEVYINKKANQKNVSWLMLPIDWANRLMSLDAKDSMCFLMIVTHVAKYGENGSILFNKKRDLIKISGPLKMKEKTVSEVIEKLVEHGLLSTSSVVEPMLNTTTTYVEPMLNTTTTYVEPMLNTTTTYVEPNNEGSEIVSFQQLTQNMSGGIIRKEKEEKKRKERDAEPLGSLGIEKLNQEYKQPLETLRVSADADEIQNQENNLIIIPECVTHLDADNLDFHKQPKKDITLSNVESLEFIPTPRHCLVGGDDTLHYNNSKVPTIDENDLTLTETHISQKSLPDRRKTTKNDVLDSQAEEVLAFLNEKTGKSFRNVPANTKIVTRCIRNSSLEEVKKVVAFKCEQWGNDPRMKEYLRPATLFAVSNFENYLGQCADWKSVPTFDEIMTSFMKKYTQEELDQITERSHERGLQQITNGEVYQ
jgi:uncharacterized phage protein (TIGR02220 family)